MKRFFAVVALSFFFTFAHAGHDGWTKFGVTDRGTEVYAFVGALEVDHEKGAVEGWIWEKRKDPARGSLFSYTLVDCTGTYVYMFLDQFITKPGHLMVPVKMSDDEPKVAQEGTIAMSMVQTLCSKLQ